MLRQQLKLLLVEMLPPQLVWQRQEEPRLAFGDGILLQWLCIETLQQKASCGRVTEFLRRF